MFFKSIVKRDNFQYSFKFKEKSHHTQFFLTVEKQVIDMHDNMRNRAFYCEIIMIDVDK